MLLVSTSTLVLKTLKIVLSYQYTYIIFSFRFYSVLAIRACYMLSRIEKKSKHNAMLSCAGFFIIFF